MTFSQHNTEAAPKIAGGVALAASTILTLAALLNHPSGASHDLISLLQMAVAERRADHIVHGAVIAALIASAFGAIILAQHLGLARVRSLAALVAYQFGCLLTILAALIDGFATPDVAVRFLKHTAEDPNFGLSSVLLIGTLIEDLTRLGIVLISAAILSWSSMLLRRGGFRHVTGVIGMVAGLLPFLLFALYSSLNPHLMIGIFGAQCLWNLGIAWILIHGTA